MIGVITPLTEMTKSQRLRTLAEWHSQSPVGEKNSVDVEESSRLREKHEHIRARWLISHSILGLADGLITNLAFLTGFAGAISDIELIRFAGIAAMLAGAVSMFFGGILASRSESDLFEADSKREAHEIQNEPEEERQELRDFYLEKGLTQDEANMVVKRITSDKKRWLEDMLIHELQLHESKIENPYTVGGVIGLSFLLGAFVPLIPYLLLSLKSNAISASVGISLGFLFFVGFLKGRVVGKTFWKSGLEMLLIGIAASVILYVIGSMLAFV